VENAYTWKRTNNRLASLDSLLALAYANQRAILYAGGRLCITFARPLPLLLRPMSPPTIRATPTEAMFHKFTDLPAELQLEVLRYCMSNQRTISVRTHVMVYGLVIINYLLVNRHLYKLAAQTYYRENTLLQRFPLGRSERDFFLVPNRLVGNHIRRLEMHLQLKDDGQDGNMEIFRYYEEVRIEAAMWGSSDMLSLIYPHGAVERSGFLKFIIDGKLKAVGIKGFLCSAPMSGLCRQKDRAGSCTGKRTLRLSRS
jgi:hypothetical protein